MRLLVVDEAKKSYFTNIDLVRHPAAVVWEVSHFQPGILEQLASLAATNQSINPHLFILCQIQVADD